MLDKNLDQFINNLVENKLSWYTPNVIITSKPFHKTKLINLLADSVKCPSILLDFDLLYSGYVESKMISKRSMDILRPRRINWNIILCNVLERMCQEKLLIIIDSFNGFYNLYGEDSTRFINAASMLLAFMGRFKRCSVVILAIAKQNKNDKWILSPGNRRISISGDFHYITAL